LNQNVKVGDKFEVMPPGGHFKLSINEVPTSNYFFFGAGSGITPLMAMIESILEATDSSVCHLLYGNRDEANIIFKEKLDRLQLVYKDRIVIDYILSQPKKEKSIGIKSIFSSPKPTWKGKIGRIDKSLIAAFLEQYPKQVIKGYYICGPGKMINARCLIRAWHPRRFGSSRIF